MKKYSKSIFLIGIVFFYSHQLSASNNSTPEDVLQNIGSTGKSIVTQAVFSIASNLIAHYSLPIIQSSIDSLSNILYGSKVKIEHKTPHELSKIAQATQLPSEIKSLIEQQTTSGRGHTPILAYGKAGTGKSLLAESIAADQQANLHTIKQNELSLLPPKIRALYLQARIAEIAETTQNNEIAIIHWEEGGDEFLASNPLHQDSPTKANKGSWKDFLLEVKNKYKNVQLYISTNAGQEKNGETFDAAIADERVKIVHIGNPEESQRSNFFKNCALNIEQNSLEHAQTILDNQLYKNKSVFPYTVSIFSTPDTEQQKRNNFLTHTFHVTPTMHQQAEQEFNKTIQDHQKNMQTWTLAIVLQPWLWQQTWNHNQEITEKINALKKSGYITPIITTDTITHEQATLLAKKTEGYSLRKLNNDLIERARAEELTRITRLNKVNTQANQTVTVTKGKTSQEYAQTHGFVCPTGPSLAQLLALQSLNTQSYSDNSSSNNQNNILQDTSSSIQSNSNSSNEITYPKPYYVIDKKKRTRTFVTPDVEGNLNEHTKSLEITKPYGAITVSHLDRATNNKDEDWQRFARKADAAANRLISPDTKKERITQLKACAEHRKKQKQVMQEITRKRSKSDSDLNK